MSEGTFASGTATAHAPLLQLHAADNGQSVVRLTWTPSSLLAAQIATYGMAKPYLAIAVRSEYQAEGEDTDQLDIGSNRWYETKSYLVPLDRGVQYISCSTPGSNEIRAIVVDMVNGEVVHRLHRGRRDKDFFEAGGQFGYRNAMGLDLSDSEYEHGFYVPYIEASNTAIMHDVAAENFAAEPSRFTRWMIGKFYTTRGFDQCNKRWRLTVSLVGAFLACTFGMILRSVVFLASLAVGRRNIPWKGFNPFNWDEAPWGRSESVWRTDARGKTDLRRFPLWLLNPLTLIGLPIIVFGISSIPEHHGNSRQTYPVIGWGFWQTFTYVDVTLFTLAIVAILAFVVVGLGSLGVTKLRGTSKLADIQTSRSERKQEDRRNEALAVAARLGALATAGTTTAPASKRSLALAFQWTKAKVCRPYPQSRKTYWRW
ncbi:MAG TPA: hypothetical protein VLF91_04020 [Candidatus Saccharimonadales bacterium]|nr:hypothetical protein [Candidatus Saccharimonadales bacterium]